MKNIDSDIVIVGAGLSGLCTAGILSRLGYRIIIVDKNNIGLSSFKKGDLRTTAVSEGSKKILQDFGFWKKISPFAEPIKKIKVCDRKISNKIDFFNSNFGENLGYIVENRILKKFFFEKILSDNNIKILDNFNVSFLENHQSKTLVKSKNICISSNLVVAADGKFSPVRKMLNVSIFEKNYNHSALFLNVVHSKDHKNYAYEIFKSGGPLAILPMKKNKNFFRSSIIWSNKKEFIKGIYNSNKLKDILNEEIGNYVGDLKKIINKKVFNLSAHINSIFYDNKVVFVGDSAHSVHPIAGQGWNLGIRDIYNLFKALKEGKDLGLESGNIMILKKYNDYAYYDAFALYHITDKLNSIFSFDNMLVNKLRSIGIDYIDNNKIINSLISSYAMGKKINILSLLKNKSS